MGLHGNSYPNSTSLMELNYYIHIIYRVYIYIYIYISIYISLSKAYGAGYRCNPSEPQQSSFSANILHHCHHTPLTPSAVDKYTAQLTKNQPAKSRLYFSNPKK